MGWVREADYRQRVCRDKINCVRGAIGAAEMSAGGAGKAAKMSARGAGKAGEMWAGGAIAVAEM